MKLSAAHVSLALLVCGLLLLPASPVLARGPGHGHGHGQGQGRGNGPGPGYRGGEGQGHGGQGHRRGGQGGDEQFKKDRAGYQFLLQNRAAITRTVKHRADGVETLTESEDPKVATAIQEHVAAMKKRVEDGNPIHLRDPLFRALFQNAAQISLKYEKTANGAKVIETSENAWVARLIQAHAEVVSGFIKNGPAEVRTNHDVPE